MSTKNSSKQPSSRATKRARFDDQPKNGTSGASPLVLLAGIVVVVALIGGAVFALTRPGALAAEPSTSEALPELESRLTGSQGLLVQAATGGHEPYPLVEAENGIIQLSLATYDDYKAHHYTYMHEGQPIEFFILKSKDGVVRAAFNACDVCFSAKEGYTQDGDHMICNNCGRRFPADKINVVHGGCNPSPLIRSVEGDTLIIEAEDIIAGSGYF